MLAHKTSVDSSGLRRVLCIIFTRPIAITFCVLLRRTTQLFIVCMHCFETKIETADNFYFQYPASHPEVTVYFVTKNRGLWLRHFQDALERGTSFFVSTVFVRAGISQQHLRVE